MKSIHALIDQVPRFGLTLSDFANYLMKDIKELRCDFPMEQGVANKIKVMWEEDAIQQVYQHRSQFQLEDSTKYFMSDLERITNPDYLPTDQDILRSRIRTSGVIETTLQIDGNTFRIFD
jgi:guanine nucleotide-binding protein G(i) subunit alpha